MMRMCDDMVSNTHSILDLDKEAASMKESADNNCIFKGYFNVRKKANMREQEEQYRSFNSRTSV